MDCTKFEICPHRRRMWVSRVQAATLTGYHVISISRKAVDWTDKPIPGMVRSKRLRLGDHTRQEPRFFLPDLEALALWRKAQELLGGLENTDSTAN